MAWLKACALARAVVDHVVMVELDAGLNDRGDHAAPRGLEPRGDERLAVRFDGS